MPEKINLAYTPQIHIAKSSRPVRLGLSQRTGVIATIIGGVLFGTSVPIIKLVLRSIPPDIFLTARFAIAIATILVLPSQRQWIHIELLRSRPMWIIAVINAIGYVLQFHGQLLTTSSNAALIISTAALMVPIIASVYHAEKLTLRKVIGVVTGFIGTTLVITRGTSFNVAGSELVGDLMILGTAVTIALIFTLSKPLTLTHGGRPIEGGIVLMTFLLLTPTVLLD